MLLCSKRYDLWRSRLGIISKSQLDEQVSFANTPREQMVEELMLEYLKMTLGKPALLEGQF